MSTQQWPGQEVSGGAQPPAQGSGGAPRPVAVAPMTPLQQADERRADAATSIDAARLSIDQMRAQLELDRARREEEDRAALARRQQEGVTDSIAQIRRVIDAAQRARQLSRDGWFATGFGATVARGIGGSAAADVEALLNTIGANQAFEKLQRMRAESPTGGALGNISNVELEMLRDSVSSLRQSQSDVQFQRSMDNVIAAYQRVLDRLEGRDPDAPREQWREGSWDQENGLMGTVTAEMPPPNDRDDEGLVISVSPQFFGPDGSPIGPDYVGPVFNRDGGYAGTIVPDGQGGRTWDNTESRRAQQIREWMAQREQVMGRPGVMDMAAQGVLFGLGDEIAGVGQAIGGAIRGDFNIGDNYRLGRDGQRLRLEQARANSGGLGVAAELLGGAVGGGGVGALARAGRVAGNAVREGIGLGALAGFGYGEGVEGSMTGAALGGALGGAIGGAVNRFGRRTNQPLTQGQRAMQAADDLNRDFGGNMQMLPADVGGPITRRATAGTAQSLFGAGPIVQRSQQLQDEAQAVLRRIAERQGTVQPSTQAAGERAIAGAQATLKRISMRVDALYARARRGAKDVRLPLPMARTVARHHIEEMDGVPGGAEGAAFLRELEQDMAGTWSVDGIREMRTKVRDKLLQNNWRRTKLESRAMDIVDAAELDIQDGLVALGLEDVARAYDDASRAAAERFRLIDDVIEPIIGPRNNLRSGEEVYAAIRRLGRGDAVTLGKFLNALPEAEANSIRATIISRLGRSTPGNNTAAGDGFSLSRFLTDWNQEALSPLAKSTLFGGELRDALDNLARVAEGTKAASRYLNTSNTGGAVMFNALLQGAPVGIAAFDIGTAAAATAASVTAQYSMGRLLASPRFARWLARLPSQNSPAAVTAHVNRLERIAAADSVIAADILGLQRSLLDSLRTGAVPVAAENQSQSAGSTTTTGGQ